MPKSNFLFQCFIAFLLFLFIGKQSKLYAKMDPYPDWENSWVGSTTYSTAMVFSENAVIFASPTMNSEHLATVKFKERVQCLKLHPKQEGDLYFIKARHPNVIILESPDGWWYKVKLRSIEGWMNGKDLIPLERDDASGYQFLSSEQVPSPSGTEFILIVNGFLGDQCLLRYAWLTNNKHTFSELLIENVCLASIEKVLAWSPSGKWLLSGHVIMESKTGNRVELGKTNLDGAECAIFADEDRVVFYNDQYGYNSLDVLDLKNKKRKEIFTWQGGYPEPIADETYPMPVEIQKGSNPIISFVIHDDSIQDPYWGSILTIDLQGKILSRKDLKTALE